MSYEQVEDLLPAEFKRFCGVRPETFRRMVEAVSSHLSRRRRVSGRPTKLSVADQVLITLDYRREYRTFFHLVTRCDLHESSVWGTIRRVEDIKFGQLSDYLFEQLKSRPSRWHLRKSYVIRPKPGS